MFVQIRGAVCALLFVNVAAASTAAGQASGRVTGRVLDASTGAGVSDATVQITGTAMGTVSAADGRYVVRAVPAGVVSLSVRRIGYQQKTVTGIVVPADGSVEQSITLSAATIRLESVVVSAASEKGTVNEALDRQRTSTGIVNAVTAEQIARSPDANAAQAVQRVSGVTIQDNKYVFVRGLGERYTTTSLNGARVPSPETDRKVVPLDLFPAGLLQTITTSKTFTPDQSGDFAGAAVDIRTREYPAGRVTTASVSSSYNSVVTGRAVLGAPRAGGEWLGFGGGARALPTLVRNFGDDFNGASRAELNQVVRSFRPVWSPTLQTGRPNSSLSLSSGGSVPLGAQSVGYLVSGSYALNNELRADEVRARAVPASEGGGGQVPFNRFEGSSGRQSVLWGGVANMSALLGGTLVTLNNLYSRSADNEARADTGLLQQGGIDLPGRRQVLSYVERTVRSSQVKLEHGFGRQLLDLAVTSSGTARHEPDRSSFVQVRYEDRAAPNTFLPYRWFAGSDEGAKRSYSDLNERSYAAALNWKAGFGIQSSEAVVKIGAAYRDTKRDVDNRIYSIRGGALTPSDLELSPELIFDGRFAQDTSLLLTPVNNTQTGFYSAHDRVAAGYGMTELPIGSRLRIVGGARVERWDLRLAQTLLNSTDPQTPDRHDVDVLPSIAANVKLGESQNLRFSAAQTLSRPEYREVSRTLYCETLGEPCTIGNDSLQRALIRNYDVRWELYPSAGELLSVGLFAKRFDRPIERIEVATSGASNFSFVNTDRATNVGVEIEARKRLGFLFDVLDPLTVFSNVTVMRSRIQVGNDQLSALTSTTRAMTGQAPYVVNAGLTYAPDGGRASGSILYNVVGRRIAAVGSKPVADTYELPRHVLDISLQVPTAPAVLLKLNAKNLLDAPVRQTSGEVTRLTYRTGRIFQLGVTWQL